MYQEHSERVPETFKEFVSCFSDDEMKLLQEWQKELYRNVMKEIEHALISLGPHIARSVFSLRAQEKQEVFAMDHEDSETRLNVSHYPNSASCISVSIPAIKQDINLVRVPDIKEEESSAVSSTGSVAFSTTEDVNTFTLAQQRSENTKQIISHTEESLPDLRLSQSCIYEEEASLLEEEEANKGTVGHVVTAVFSLGGNSEEEMHYKMKEEPGERTSVTKDCSSTPLEYVQSQQGSKMLVWRGYLHRKERETSGKVLWRCARYQMLKCRCRLHTIGDEVVHYRPHNHLPKPWEVESKKSKATVRKKQPVKRKANMDTF